MLFEHTTGKPSPISLRGVELLSADIDSGVARITIEPSSGLPCADGVYEVLVDDSLGTEMSVVAVLDDALLLDRDGSLHYLPTDAEARIEWSMVWRSRFGVAPKTTAPRGTKRVTPKRPRTHKRR